MNSLSWALYFAGVVGMLQNYLIVVTVLGLVVSGCWAFLAYMHEDRNYRTARNIFPFFLLLGVFTNFVPSKDTVYLIIASETGGQVATSPELVKVRKVVNEYLDDMIEKEEANDDP